MVPATHTVQAEARAEVHCAQEAWQAAQTPPEAINLAGGQVQVPTVTELIWVAEEVKEAVEWQAVQWVEAGPWQAWQEGWQGWESAWGSKNMARLEARQVD